MDIKEAIKGLAEISERTNPINEGDYQKDGLWYCGKCNTPKQSRIEICGEIFTPMCMCKCESEKYAKEENDIKRKQKEYQVELLKNECFPEEAMKHQTFENDDGTNEKMSSICRKYAENFKTFKADGKGLLLFGTTGVGKTFYAIAIANAVMEQEYSALVVSMARAVEMETRDISKFDLLVIDDLSSERNTEYMAEKVHTLIDYCYQMKKPVIVTTNLSSDAIKHPSDIRYQRLFSRLMEMCLPYEIVGQDRRKDILRKDFEKYRGLLE